MEPAVKSALRSFGTRKVIERHDRLEGMIEPPRFLVGDRPTLADALLAGVARWLDFHAVAERSRWPKLGALRARLEADPAVVYATALENGDRVPGRGSCAGHIALAEVVAQFGK